MRIVPDNTFDVYSLIFYGMPLFRRVLLAYSNVLLVYSNVHMRIVLVGLFV